MGKFSRDKGARGEREFAALCREYGYDAMRTAQHKGRNGGEPDVIGLPGLHVEVKRTEKLRLHDAHDQAVRDAKPGRIPVVAHKHNHYPWFVTVEANNFLLIYKEYEAGLALKEREHEQSKQQTEVIL